MLSTNCELSLSRLSISDVHSMRLLISSMDAEASPAFCRKPVHHDFVSDNSNAENVDEEVLKLRIHRCDWHKVFDLDCTMPQAGSGS